MPWCKVVRNIEDRRKRAFKASGSPFYNSGLLERELDGRES